MTLPGNDRSTASSFFPAAGASQRAVLKENLMTEQQTAMIQECAALSIAGKISFGAVVNRLMGIGLERYHADYTRHECTYYMPDGQSLVVPVNHSPQPIAQTFSATGVEAAVRQAQRGEIFYPEFLKQTFAAGCVGYFVQITGRQVIYFGRNGEQHVEKFPLPPPVSKA
jgi:uncharacterized protein YbcV (DUF1398 family)